MIVRFCSDLVSDFDQRNFSALSRRIGLYFIFLKTLLIPYPFKNSRLIYIGMSESRVNSIGNRLRDHHSGRSGNKGIFGYRKRHDVDFTYLDEEFLEQVFTSDKIQDLETSFLENFADEFGVYPICNNKRGVFQEEGPKKLLPKIDWAFFGGGDERTRT